MEINPLILKKNKKIEVEKIRCLIRDSKSTKHLGMKLLSKRFGFFFDCFGL
jgi:hypothetical protein